MHGQELNRLTAITHEDLNNWFSHHPPKGKEAIKTYQEIREAGRLFAQELLRLTPQGYDQMVAIQKIREAVMMANAAIACHVPVDPQTAHFAGNR